MCGGRRREAKYMSTSSIQFNSTDGAVCRHTTQTDPPAYWEGQPRLCKQHSLRYKTHDELKKFFCYDNLKSIVITRNLLKPTIERVV